MPGVQESSARIAGLMYAEREAVWVNGGGQSGQVEETKRTKGLDICFSGFSVCLVYVFLSPNISLYR